MMERQKYKMAKNLTLNKKRPVKHLNEIQAKVHLKSAKIKVIVEIPWSALERRFNAELETKKFRRKRRK
jgi:hypothetical protein